MAWDYRPCTGGEMLFHTKRIEQAIDIPKYRAVLPDTFVSMPALRDIDLTQHEYLSKYAAQTLCSAMELYLRRKGRDLRHFFVLNNGSEFVGYQERKRYPQLIEKKIHQIWVGGEMPAFKQLLAQRIRDNHPDYEYSLWTNANITRENFPVSYDLITALLEFNENSRYNKLSMVSDLMRA
jgi:mannosyltransferase OCH1-like enzyme